MPLLANRAPEAYSTEVVWAQLYVVMCVHAYIRLSPFSTFMSPDCDETHNYSVLGRNDDTDDSFEVTGSNIKVMHKNLVEIVAERALVLFRAGTSSLQSGFVTFFVPLPDHAKHFRQIFSVQYNYNANV